MKIIRFRCTDKGQHGSRLLLDVAHSPGAASTKVSNRLNKRSSDGMILIQPRETLAPYAEPDLWALAPHEMDCPCARYRVSLSEERTLQLFNALADAGQFSPGKEFADEAGELQAVEVAFVDISLLPQKVRK